MTIEHVFYCSAGWLTCRCGIVRLVAVSMSILCSISQSNPRGAAYACSGISPRGGVSPRSTRHLRGQSTIEYVLIIAIIALMVLIVGPWVSSAIRNQFNTVTETLDEGASGIAFKDPVDIPDPKRGTAFAVYSADDHSLMFYKRRGVPEVGDMFNYRRVTEVYTGFESDKYVNLNEDKWGCWYWHEPNIPWWSVRTAIRTVNVVDSGIAPASIDYWFYKMENLSSIDVQKLDTSRCSDFFLTFGWCGRLTSIDLSSWSTQSLIKLNGTVLGCGRMESLFLGGWETSNVVSFHCLFHNCKAMSDSAMQSAINQLQITEKATDFGLMFEGCDNLNLDCSDWNVRADAIHDGFNNEAPGVILPMAWQ